jgi:hypothetical protein
MDYRRCIFLLFMLTLAMAVRAQSIEDRKHILQPDSAKNDFEEWLRNEPMRPGLHDSTAISPIEPSELKLDPEKIKPKQPPISINIMTPALRNDMRLAYHSHWLEEQRKAQQGGAMTIGINPLSLIAVVIHKLFPKHKSKKQRERERLQQILDNY